MFAKCLAVDLILSCFQDFIVNKLGFTDEKEYVEARIEEADVDR